MTEDQARKLEVPIEWNSKANVCVYCGRVPETFYVVTGHDHTDDSIRWCICREAGQYKDEITTLRQRVQELEKELEVERMRLVACSTAALGYFNGCCDEYKSASLADVLCLRESNEKLTAERNHWKNNHETEVRRARILKERTDMPIERVQAYDKWGEDQARIDRLTAERDALKQQRDELLAAAEAIEIDAEECLDFDECSAMLVSIDAYHKLMEAIASINEK